jgi:hypothetical protein
LAWKKNDNRKRKFNSVLTKKKAGYNLGKCFLVVSYPVSGSPLNDVQEQARYPKNKTKTKKICMQKKMQKIKINLPHLRKKMYITNMTKLFLSFALLALLASASYSNERPVDYNGKKIKCVDYAFGSDGNLTKHGKVLKDPYEGTAVGRACDYEDISGGKELVEKMRSQKREKEKREKEKTSTLEPAFDYNSLPRDNRPPAIIIKESEKQK